MGNVRKLVKEIDHGVNLDKNLPVYADLLLDTYREYSAIELTFSAYILAEMMEEKESASQSETSMYSEVIDQMKGVLSESANHSEHIDKLKKIREKITQIMEVYTSYTDRLVCYDYVLKRMRLDFAMDADTQNELNAIHEEEFMQRLMTYAAGNRDQTVIRERFQMLMGEIPVHMTKSKFLEKVNGAITLYNGSDKSSLDEFVYMIRSAAMLLSPEDDEFGDEKIHNFLKRMKEINLNELQPATYLSLCDELEDLSRVIMQVTDFFYSLQKVVNGLYAFCLSRLKEAESTETEKICYDVLNQIVSGKRQEDSLVCLEGKIEKCVERSSILEAVLFETKSSNRDKLEQLGLYEDFTVFATTANLLSDSLFIDLERKNTDELVDMSQIKNVSATLSNELSEQLSSLPKQVKKAVMATVLEKIPVDFNRASEMEEYIRTNLLGCQNYSEKSVVMLELKDMMDEALDWRG